MCGIAGCVDLSRTTSPQQLEVSIDAMTSGLVHRGPDDRGTWVDAEAGLALGHRRLSIFDLSATGHQPMRSSCGRFTIVYNGEIYNHDDLRRDLASRGLSFRGTSDTEVLLEAIAGWGLDETLRRVNGMFAFALWNHTDRTLTLARDRIGIKPLYYGWTGRTFLFASELKALRRHPTFQPAVNRDALALLLEHSYIPAPASIYQGIRKLPAATTLTLTLDASPGGPQPVPYWSLAQIAELGSQNPFSGTQAQAIDALEELLRDAVHLRTQADVPLGAFLSGGIDSSTIVALMQAQDTHPVKAFTIGFDVPEYDESGNAAAIASHLGVEHFTHRVTAAEAQAVIPQLPTLYDEPFADSSQIPTYLVSTLAREHVTVSLSGDGGDELFGGYNRYSHIGRIWKKIAWLPIPLRKPAARCLEATQSLRRRRGHEPGLWNGALAARTAGELYHFLNRHWRFPENVVIDGQPTPTPLSQFTTRPDRGNFLEEMMFVDTLTYLPECILTKVDRASMGVSLEARVPLLDHRVVEFAWSLSAESKVVAGVGKWPLQKLLARHAPAQLLDRPKVGFGVPIDTWLRGPLRDWAEDLLSEQRLTREGYLNPAPIREKWSQHVAGECNWHYLLWDVLMFQAWLGASRTDFA